MELKKVVLTAVFMAIGVLTAHLIYIPVGIAKCFPIQHAINVLLAISLGTKYSVSGALGISILRNILGTGSILAFPGSLFGAFFAGVLYKRTNHVFGAIIGEMIGTGIIGALVAFPVAKYILGSGAGAFFFVIPFLVSSTGGSLIAYLISKTSVIEYFSKKSI